MSEEKWVHPGNLPQWKTNYECFITDTGKWETGIYGKFLLLIKQIDSTNNCPWQIKIIL